MVGRFYINSKDGAVYLNKTDNLFASSFYSFIKKTVIDS